MDFFSLKRSAKSNFFQSMFKSIFLFLPSALKIRAHSFFVFASFLFTFFSCDERLYGLNLY